MVYGKIRKERGGGLGPREELGFWQPPSNVQTMDSSVRCTTREGGRHSCLGMRPWVTTFLVGGIGLQIHWEPNRHIFGNKHVFHSVEGQGDGSDTGETEPKGRVSGRYQDSI